MESLALMLSASVNAGTILALAALGLLVNERAGIINLGAEGMMLVGALAAYATAAHGPARAGVRGGGRRRGGGGGGVRACVVGLGTNQYATGLALSLFGAGFTAFAGTGYTDNSPEPGGSAEFPTSRPAGARSGAVRLPPARLPDRAVAGGLSWFFFRSRRGLVVRAVGESPEAAHALGHPVRCRSWRVLAGGALCGLAGAYVSLVYAHLWVEGPDRRQGLDRAGADHLRHMASGARAAGRLPVRGLTMLQFHLQGRGVEMESHLLNMSPYLATVAC